MKRNTLGLASQGERKKKEEMASSDIKGFFRQRKGSKTKRSPLSKPSAKSGKSVKVGLALGADLTQPPALVSHASFDTSDDYDKCEEVLRQFDLNMGYGPCIGLTRLERWERAYNLGLNPPKDVENLLGQGKVALECMWDGRV